MKCPSSRRRRRESLNAISTGSRKGTVTRLLCTAYGDGLPVPELEPRDGKRRSRRVWSDCPPSAWRCVLDFLTDRPLCWKMSSCHYSNCYPRYQRKEEPCPGLKQCPRTAHPSGAK